MGQRVKARVQQVVPDGGWGWVLVFVSFFFHLTCGFIFVTQSILFVALQEQFGQGKGLTSWILSIFCTVFFIVGPISATLSSRFSHKTVTFFGGLLMSLGTFISCFATSVIFLFFSLGVVAGFGAGMCYVSAISMCAIYFDKKRSLAIGLGTSGVGVGTLAFPRLVIILEEEYTWRGLLLILSAFTLNMCAMALLMRPLATTVSEELDVLVDDEHNMDAPIPSEDNPVYEIGEFLVSDDKGQDGISVEVTVLNGNDEDDADDGMKERGKLIVTGDEEELCMAKVSGVTIRMSPTPEVDVVALKSPSPNTAQLSNMAVEIMKKNKYLFHDMECYGIQKSNQKTSVSTDNINKKSNHRHFHSVQELSKQQSSLLEFKQVKTEDNNKSLSNLSLMLMGSIYNVGGLDFKLDSMLSVSSKNSKISIAADASQITGSEYACNNMASCQEDNDASFPIEYRNHPRASFYSRYLQDYTRMMKNGKFSLMSMCNFIVNLTYMTPVLYIVDRAVEHGIEKEDAVLALSMYGAGNIFGRIFIAMVADCPCVNRALLFFVCILLSGLITSLSIFCGHHLSLHGLYGALFGLFIGGYVSLTPVVLADILGVALVGQSYGLSLVFMAVATIIGTPMAGWMFDMTGSYQVSFLIYGFSMVLSSLLLVPLIVASVRGRNKKNIQDS